MSISTTTMEEFLSHIQKVPVSPQWHDSIRAVPHTECVQEPGSTATYLVFFLLDISKRPELRSESSDFWRLADTVTST